MSDRKFYLELTPKWAKLGMILCTLGGVLSILGFFVFSKEYFGLCLLGLILSQLAYMCIKFVVWWNRG